MHPAIENLKAEQRQLDPDGVEVGVSRQALEEALALNAELLNAAIRVIATRDEFFAYAKVGMPARALLTPPDREAGNRAFADLRAAILKATDTPS
jgi:hypothetical protein